MPSPREFGRARVRIPYWRTWPFLVGAAVLSAGAGAILQWPEPGAIATLVGSVILMFVGRDAERFTELRDVSADDEAVYLGKRRIRRARIRGAFTVPRKRKDSLRLTRRFAPQIDLDFERVVDADALANELGFHPRQKALHVWLLSTMSRRLGVLTLAAMIVLAILVRIANRGFNLLFFSAVAAVLAFFVVCLAPRSVRIGVDGVSDAWLWRRRFVALRDIRGARVVARPMGFGNSRTTEHFLLVEAHDGKHLSINAGNQEQAEILLERVRSAMRVRSADPDAPALDDLLAPGGRTGQAWLAHLRSLLTTHAHAAGYRAVAIERNDLVRVASDRDRPTHVRVAAVAALDGAQDDEERSELVRVASASADPKLRAAFDALLADKEDDASRARALEASIGGGKRDPH